MQKITLVAACGNNNCIGIDNGMPWHLPEDFAFFRTYTAGKPVVMGRKTWESLPKKRLRVCATGKQVWIPSRTVLPRLLGVMHPNQKAA